MNTVVSHHPDALQFIALVEGKMATLNYTISPDNNTLDYYRTFVPPELRGRQIGQDIVRYALDYAKENQLSIKPTCPFVKAFIDKHPEYLSLLAS